MASLRSIIHARSACNLQFPLIFADSRSKKIKQKSDRQLDHFFDETWINVDQYRARGIDSCARSNPRAEGA
jgi:hypothetical protein